MIKFIFINIFICILLLSSQSEAMSIPNFDINYGNLSGDGVFKLSLDKLVSARRGGGSFGGRRGFSRSRSSSRGSSRSASRPAARPANPQKTPSFGGKRMSSQQASAKYGTPRKVQTMSGTNAAGAPMNYNIHHYGGFSSSLMTGYMMGNMAWWMMAPSMLYSRPVYVEKPDGSVDVYPPSFDWGRLFTILLVLAVIVLVIRSYRRSKNSLRQSYNQSSFS